MWCGLGWKWLRFFDFGKRIVRRLILKLFICLELKNSDYCFNIDKTARSQLTEAEQQTLERAVDDLGTKVSLHSQSISLFSKDTLINYRTPLQEQRKHC